ncbi:MAG: DNA gyrase subunit A, partial [Sandaracinaceae bacterium]|nr:DNA gyrase subunit A [Sandaracinaceae bacterium]
ARVVRETDEVIVGTAAGMSIRFAVTEVRPMGRDTRGVRGIELREGDHVVGMDVVESEEQQVLSVSANGFGKRTPITEWRLQGRGGKGIIAMETSERNGPLVKLRLVEPNDQIMVVTDGGQIIRTHVQQIREAGRNTQGVIILRVAEGERVVDVEPVAEMDQDDERTSVLPGDLLSIPPTPIVTDPDAAPSEPPSERASEQASEQASDTDGEEPGEPEGER